MLFILKLRATLLFIQRAPNNFIKVPEPVMFSYITKRERDMYKICMSWIFSPLQLQLHCLQMYEIWKCSAGWHPPSWRSPAGCCQGWGARWPWSMSGTWSQLRGTKTTTRRRSHFYDALRISKYWNIFTFNLPVTATPKAWKCDPPPAAQQGWQDSGGGAAAPQRQGQQRRRGQGVGQYTVFRSIQDYWR